MGLMGSSSCRRAAIAAVMAMAAGLPLAAGAAAGAAPRAVRPSLVLPVHWTACKHGIPSPFQCATEPVPLNYADPGGARIRIALIRLPAADPRPGPTGTSCVRA